jgi:uncharacterized protein (DUF302 family)
MSALSETPITYTVVTDRTFDDAVAAVEAVTDHKGFRVLHVHDVAQTLRDKGFPHAPLKIVEICNAAYASRALGETIELSALLPCKISVYEDGGAVYISAFLPSVMTVFFPGPGVVQVASEVEAVVRAIVDEAS